MTKLILPPTNELEMNAIIESFRKEMADGYDLKIADRNMPAFKDRVAKSLGYENGMRSFLGTVKNNRINLASDVNNSVVLYNDEYTGIVAILSDAIFEPFQSFFDNSFPWVEESYWNESVPVTCIDELIGIGKAGWKYGMASDFKKEVSYLFRSVNWCPIMLGGLQVGQACNSFIANYISGLMNSLLSRMAPDVAVKLKRVETRKKLGSGKLSKLANLHQVGHLKLLSYHEPVTALASMIAFEKIEITKGQFTVFVNNSSFKLTKKEDEPGWEYFQMLCSGLELSKNDVNLVNGFKIEYQDGRVFEDSADWLQFANDYNLIVYKGEGKPVKTKLKKDDVIIITPIIF